MESPPRYYTVVRTYGVVVAYEMHLPTGTPIAAARAIAAQEFPADTHRTWYRVADTCSQESVTSVLVQRNLVSAGYATMSDSPYYFVEFDTQNAGGTSSYDPNNINDIIFSTVGAATPADALAC